MKPPFLTTSHPSKLSTAGPKTGREEAPGLILPQLPLARGRGDTSRQSLGSLCPVSPPLQPPTSHFTCAVALLTCH